MTKRTQGLPRNPRDFYPTPPEAVEPLLRHLLPEPQYDEPMAGAGHLINALPGKCWRASDIEPQTPGIIKRDVMTLTDCVGDVFISNPPYPLPGKKGEPTLGIIEHLSDIAPTWLLMPWDMGANKYFSRVAWRCTDVQVIGRVSFMMNGKKGYENYAWFRFDGRDYAKYTQFHSQ